VLGTRVSGSAPSGSQAKKKAINDKGDAENTIQVLAELKKQQREAPFKAPQITDGCTRATPGASREPDD
jgi:hypothetical protein